MKLAVQPGKRQGSPKLLLARKLLSDDIKSNADGLTVTVTASDIYTPKATQRFTISFSAEEIEMLRSRSTPMAEV